METKSLNQFIRTAEKLGVHVNSFDSYIEIQYYTKHGGEEIIEVDKNENLAQYLADYDESYDPSEETYIWLDETGHGKNGAPHDMRDILADKEEWEGKIEELAMVAAKCKL